MNFKSLFNFGPAANLNELYKNGALVIDVRTPMEFREGHFENSENIPLNEIDKSMDKIKSYNKDIILVCRSGMRSGQATGMLKRNGISAVNGGGWEAFKAKIES